MRSLDKGITVYTGHSRRVWLSSKGYAVLACFGLFGGCSISKDKEDLSSFEDVAVQGSGLIRSLRGSKKPPEHQKNLKSMGNM